MNKLTPLIFLIPVIALILVVLLFIYLLKKVDDKKTFKRFSFIVLILAFLLNFAWEVAQLPLYKNASYDMQHIVFCALASVADAIMVLLIYFSLAVIYKHPLWIQNFKWQRIITAVLIGGIGAVLAEIRHKSQGNWAYADSMPIIPVVDAGLSPVLQFVILPTSIYLLSFYFLIKRRQNKKKEAQFFNLKKV
jgi:signal transduction histidine kinase